MTPALTSDPYCLCKLEVTLVVSIVFTSESFVVCTKSDVRQLICGKHNVYAQPELFRKLSRIHGAMS